jgi:hypothetical protein
VGEVAKLGWTGPDCQRIAKRLTKHSGELFTFVACPGVEGTNNRAEGAFALRGEAEDLRRPSVLAWGKETFDLDERA